MTNNTNRTSYLARVGLLLVRMLGLVVLLALLLPAGKAAAQTATFPSGSGTLSDPYQIATLNNLYWITQDTSRWGKVYRQTADIDASSTTTWASGKGFSPIGNDTRLFSGSYDGQSFKISGLFINKPSTVLVGLFGRTDGATISNVKLESVNISGDASTGGLYVGGLIGYQTGRSSATNCSSSGSVMASYMWSAVGGLIGYQEYSSVATNCFSSGSVSGGSNVVAGGLVGAQQYASSAINCYSSASVTAGTAASVGGLIGDQRNDAAVTNCYSTGSVAGGAASLAGGLIGSRVSSSTATNCFWDITTSGKSTSAGGTGKTTAQMKDYTTFTGWSFKGIGGGTIWNIGNSRNNGYPYLNWQYPNDPSIGSQQTTVSSTFDTNSDGWIIEGLGGGPMYVASGGNPGGYIYGEDAGGDDWYFKAPTKFLANQSAAYGGTLSFDLRQYYTSSQYDIEDIIIEGGGLRIVFDTPSNPGTSWTHYQVSLTETAGWKKTSLSGAAPTAAEMRTIFGSVTRLLIRGEYQNGTDKCDLDNVVLSSGSSSGSGKASLKPSVAGYVQAGKPFWVEVRVGDPIAVSGLYGLALKLQSDASTCTYVDGTGAAGSFLGTSPLSFFRKVNAQTVDLGVTMSSGPGSSGAGNVARVQFVSSVTGPVRFSMRDIQGVDQAGTAIPFDTSTTVITVSGPMVVPVASGPYQVGQPFTVEVYASGMNVGTGLYGISFKLKSDKLTCTYVDGSGAAGTFLGLSPLTFFQKVNTQMVDMGVTKSSAPGVTGTGPVAKAQFVSSASGTIRFTLSDVMAVDQYGARITVDTMSLSIIIGGPSVKPVAIGPYQIYKPFTVMVQASDFTSNPALYGVAFKLRSDVPSCTYVDGSAAAGAFMSTTAISYFRMVDAQTVDMGVTRTTAPGSIGSGTIATAQFVPTSGASIRFTLLDVTAVDQYGASIPVNLEPFSVTTINAVEREGTVPTEFDLSHNYPNPFNPSTTIRFSLVQESPVQLTVYDVLGRQVAVLIDQRMDAGTYSVEWNAGTRPSGLYLYELRAGNSSQMKKMMLMK